MDAIEYIQKKLEERRELLVLALSRGSAKDYAEYRDLCGQVQGLAAAQMDINDLSREIKDNDEN